MGLRKRTRRSLGEGGLIIINNDMALFNNLSRELKAREERRELVIKTSREILRESKRIIFLCHEGADAEVKKAILNLKERIIKESARLSKPLVSRGPDFFLESEGVWAASQEEFLEAWFLYQVASRQKLSLPSQLSASPETIVGGLSDLTGELLRQVVLRATERDLKTVKRLHGISVSIIKELLPLYLTGQGRMKFDSAKRNLKRIEEILYEVTIRS